MGLSTAVTITKAKERTNQASCPTINEDTECTLVFVDILGFAALTEKFPKHLIHSGSDQQGFQSTSSSETFNTFNRFHRILEQSVFAHSLNGAVRAMLFSDCAFLKFGNSLLASAAATDLMRAFIGERVPVRMGIDRGTFYFIKFSTDITDSTIITRSRFVGTAVVRASAAERCGGKGFRIFVHPSAEPELAVIQRRIKIIPLGTPNKAANWELDFLHEATPAQRKPSAEDLDTRLFEAVLEMKREAPIDEQFHHAETIEAMNRMRKANSRPPFEMQVPKRKGGGTARNHYPDKHRKRRH